MKKIVCDNCEIEITDQNRFTEPCLQFRLAGQGLSVYFTGVTNEDFAVCKDCVIAALQDKMYHVG